MGEYSITLIQPPNYIHSYAFYDYEIGLLLQNSFKSLKLGSAYYLLGYYDEAEAYFRKVLEINPDFSDTNFDLGMTLQKQV